MMAEDRYANRAGIAVTESAAGTITFQELITGVGFNTKKGMLIDQLDYTLPQATLALLVGDQDLIRFAIVTSVGVGNLEDPTDLRILHAGQISIQLFGTAGNMNMTRMPLQHQFFPSLIHAHIRIYLAVQSGSLASAATVRARMLWRFVDLSDREVAELVQATLLQA